jgi:hypothetical protein
MLWGRKSLYIFPRVLQASSSHKAQMIFTEPTSKKWYERQLSLMLTGLGTLSSSWWSYRFVCCRPDSSGSNETWSLGNRHRIDLLPRQEPPSVQGRICFWHR